MDRILVERKFTFTPPGEEAQRLVARIGYPEVDPKTEVYRQRMGYEVGDPRGLRWRVALELDGLDDIDLAPYAYGPNEAKAVVEAMYLFEVQARRLLGSGAVEVTVGDAAWHLLWADGRDDDALSATAEKLERWGELSGDGTEALTRVVCWINGNIMPIEKPSSERDAIVAGMAGLERFMVEFRCEEEVGLASGPPVTDETIIELRNFRRMVTGWLAGGELAPSAGETAQRLTALLNGSVEDADSTNNQTSL